MVPASLHTLFPLAKDAEAELTISTSDHQEIRFLRISRDTEDLNLTRIISFLREQMAGTVTAWCLALEDALQNCVTLLLLTNDFHLIQTLNHPNLADADILSAATDFLSYKNDGTVTQMLIDRNLHITTMESCTSGLIASNITDYEGSSSIFRGAHITYSNEAKVLAGVDKNILDAYGVYSPETARDMARNAKIHFHSDISIGVTGSFGNVDPANPDSVAGEVHYQISMKNESPIQLVFHRLDVPRKELKQRTVDIVLATLYAMLKNFS